DRLLAVGRFGFRFGHFLVGVVGFFHVFVFSIGFLCFGFVGLILRHFFFGLPLRLVAFFGWHRFAVFAGFCGPDFHRFVFFAGLGVAFSPVVGGKVRKDRLAVGMHMEPGEFPAKFVQAHDHARLCGYINTIAAVVGQVP